MGNVESLGCQTNSAWLSIEISLADSLAPETQFILLSFFLACCRSNGEATATVANLITLFNCFTCYLTTALYIILLKSTLNEW